MKNFVGAGFYLVKSLDRKDEGYRVYFSEERHTGFKFRWGEGILEKDLKTGKRDIIRLLVPEEML